MAELGLTGPPVPAETPVSDHAVALVNRQLRRGSLFRASTVNLFGTTAARVLGFLFAVLAARLLSGSGYGLVAYALAVGAVGSILLVNAATGLAPRLSRFRDDPMMQDAYFSNWMVAVAGLLLLSLALAFPLSLAARLPLPMVLGVAAYQVGVAVYQAYREVQRGKERYGRAVLFYMLANVIQLVAIALAALAGHSDPVVFVVIYGLSNLVALALLWRPGRPGLRFRLWTLSRHFFRQIFRYGWPLILQAGLFALWFNADLILLDRFRPTSLVGGYAVAKTLAMACYMIPSAVSTVVSQRTTTRHGRAAHRYLAGVLVVTLFANAVVLDGFLVFGPSLIDVVFGDRYAQAMVPLPWLGAGMFLYGTYQIFASAWQGIGRTDIDALSTGCAAAVTIVACFALIPGSGPLGAALAFAAGAAAQLAVIAIFTLRTWRRLDQDPVPLSRRRAWG